MLKLKGTIVNFFLKKLEMNSLLVLKLLLIAIYSFLIVKIWSLIEMYWISRKFDVNDYVQLNGSLAKVREVGFTDLVLQVYDNPPITVPLKKIKQSALINLTKSNTPIKGQVAFKTSNTINSKKIEKILLQIVKKHDQITDSPKSYVSIVRLRNEDTVFHLYFYSHDFDGIDEIENDLKNEILDAFIKRDITHLFRSPLSERSKKISFQ